MADFASCRAKFEESANNQALYTYKGPVWGGRSENGSYITTTGCEALCSRAPQLYTWKDAAETIATWIMPVLGVLIGAPFEPNQTWETVKLLCRWLGSPFVCLSYILWNIKITSRSCLMLDMAAPYDYVPEENGQFAQLRDSLYILSVMNQYDTGKTDSRTIRMVRMALFSNESPPDSDESLDQTRKVLARALRATRRRGIVPVFVSLLWFIMCLAISIEAAFEELGSNIIGYDLALGLLLIWVPILVLCSLVDRNPALEFDSSGQFNNLVQKARRIEQRQSVDPASNVECVTQTKHDDLDGAIDLFRDFAGQGRKRWYCGIGPPIVANIERYIVAPYGRGWLQDVDRARELLLGANEDLDRTEKRPGAFGPTLFAVFIIVGSAGSALLVSIITPTVGIGCHCASYLVYLTLATFLALVEMLVWWLTSEQAPIRKYVHTALSIGEFISTAWLCMIVLAQTIGFFQTCRCIGGFHTSHEGYIDFDLLESSPSSSIAVYWVVACGVACFVLVLGLMVATYCWLEQAHMSTLDFAKAQSGLQATRRFKLVYMRMTWVPRSLAKGAVKLVHSISGKPEASPDKVVWANKPLKVSTAFSPRRLGSGSTNKGSS